MIAQQPDQMAAGMPASDTSRAGNSGAAVADESLSPRMTWAVDVGFVALLVMCAVRYYSVHPFDGRGLVVLLLAAGSCVAYAVSVIGSPQGALSRAGVLAATGLWFPLMWLAPSFGWAAFALFFAVHRVLPSLPARWLSGAIVVAVCIGMLILTGGQDLGLMLGPLLGGIVLAVVYAQLNRVLEYRGRLITQLVETQQQLARSEREAGALAERTRVASELHDTVVQQTASALLLLEAAGSESPQITAATDALRETLVETRQLMHGLTNPRAASGSLVAALAAVAAEHNAEFVLIGDERALTHETAHALTRVCQEALTNVGRHARATRVNVTLTFFGDAVGVDIADNGVGFSPLSATGPGEADDSGTEDQATKRGLNAQPGYGLRAMAWRIESLGGTFSLESAPDAGAVIAAVVPAPHTLGGEV